MFAYIANDEIMGFTNIPDIAPAGWRAEPTPTDNRDRIYWHREDEEVKIRPSKPSDQHTWNKVTYSWDAPPPPFQPPQRVNTARHPLAVAMYNYVKETQDETLADIIALLFAEIFNDTQLRNQRFNKLRNHFDIQ